ncbi:MAG: response regulator transcription factor [Spirochaetaceae bacterium]|nr:response regulator transcription factor [Spirochaetaceae bacterium]RKX90257.1 MAG: DNA-binding response regulator [Spirochaetota bacterium]RKX97547.1 MAG: DNA-binding response regulator [Spirochaetota bacterium]
MPDPINIIICDDQDIVREGLKTILEADSDIRVIATAEDGEDLFRQIESSGIPDMVIMDLKMPVINGIQATRMLRSRHPNTKVLVLTTYDDDQWVMDAIRAGASGYLLKDTPRIDLIDAIKGTLQGQTFVDPSVAGKMLAMAAGTIPRPVESSAPDIRPREKQILLLIARGMSNADIAAELYLSEGTVRNYASALFNRIGVTDRTQAAIAALRYGIISLDDI